MTFCCPVNGYPPPIVTWAKNGTNVQTGESSCYNTASVKNEDFGNYTCVATDGITTTDPFVFSLLEKEKEEPGKLFVISDVHVQYIDASVSIQSVRYQY